MSLPNCVDIKMINRHGTSSMHRLEKSKKICFFTKVIETENEEAKRVDKWTSILESNPNANGTYYVYVMNCMDNSSDILKLRFDNKIKDKLGWLKEHHNELKAAFNYDVEINYDYFEIAETLTECLCEYPHFLWDGYVRYIDKVYVIIVII